jgi:hypothetical protein
VTQTEHVLKLLRERGAEGLTPIDALALVGCFRLAARVSDAKALIEPTEEIVTERATSPVNGKSFARYVLRPRVAHPADPQIGLWR